MQPVVQTEILTIDMPLQMELVASKRVPILPTWTFSGRHLGPRSRVAKAWYGLGQSKLSAGPGRLLSCRVDLVVIVVAIPGIDSLDVEFQRLYPVSQCLSTQSLAALGP